MLSVADLRYKVIRKLSLDTFEINQIDRMILAVEDFYLLPSEVSITSAYFNIDSSIIEGFFKQYSQYKSYGITI